MSLGYQSIHLVGEFLGEADAYVVFFGHKGGRGIPFH